MSSDERNFRSTYYEKVGFKNVEEKKSLEILLKDKVLDRTKLKQFCLRFTVPTVYRGLVWKVLLGVLPVHVDSHAFCMEHRRDECRDTVQALQVMRLIDANASQHELMYAMWLIQTHRWREIDNMKLDDGFLLISKSLGQFFEDDADLYWIIKNLYIYILSFKGDFPKLIEATWSLLEKEDNSLYKQLKESGILTTSTLEHWFISCLTGIFDDKALLKIFDKLCGGSYKILVFFIVTLLINQRTKLLKCNNKGLCLQRIGDLPEEVAEVVVNKAIDLWQQHGSPLTVHDKPKP